MKMISGLPGWTAEACSNDCFISLLQMDTQPASVLVYKGDLSLCIRYVPADKLTKSPNSGRFYDRL